MNRYEITNSAAQTIDYMDICVALKLSGAARVNSRHAHGMRNQPVVATFAATDQDSAIEVCNRASDRLGVSLIPFRYTGGVWKHNPNTNLSEFKETCKEE